MMAPTNVTLANVRIDMQALEHTIRDRSGDIKKYQAYYDGDQPLKFATEEYREWFAEQYEGFADNWCAPVVDATVERMKLEGVRPHEATRVDKELQRAWERNAAQAESKLAFTTAAITKRAFALVWGDKDGNPLVSFEHPSECAVAYVPGSRRERRSAFKMWRDGDADFGIYYTAHEVYKWKRKAPSESAFGTPGFDPDKTGGVSDSGGGDWEPWEVPGEPWPMRNPMGKVPMVEIQNRPRLVGDPINEISGVAAMQDAINTLWSYLFTAADYAALPQKVILGAQLPKVPILDENGKKVGEKPVDLPEANIKRILNLEGPDAKISQWSAAKLDVFTDVIGKAVSHVANQTRTPLHYFAASIENISGDTLQALETGLNAKVADRKLFFDDPILEVFSLMALAMGNKAKSEAVLAGTALWSDHEVRSEQQKMDKLAKMKELGFPFEYLLETYTGGDADEVQRILDMRKEEAKNDPLSYLMNPEEDQDDAGIKRSGGSDNGESTDTRQARRDEE